MSSPRFVVFVSTAAIAFAAIAAQSLEQQLKALPGASDYTFHLKRDAFADSIGLDFDSLDPSGYYLARRGRHVIVAGRTGNGDRIALANFLKRYAGYRNFGTPFGTIPPHADRLVLPEDFTIRDEPDVPSAYISGAKRVFDGMGAFGRGIRTTCVSTHALDLVVKPSMWDKHPEYFPLVNGKRVDPKSGPWNPCLSNPDLPKLFDAYADGFFSNNVYSIGIPMGVNDGGVDCHCPGCEALWRKHGNQYAAFYNMAAKRLAKSHPGKMLAFIAYSERCIDAPRGMTMEPNVCVEVTGMVTNMFEALRSWRAAGVKNFGVYEYLYGFGGGGRIVPGYYPHDIADYIRSLHREFGLKTFFEEYHSWSPIIDAGRQYVINELLWNMEADVDAVLDDYFNSLYGPAKKPMRRFHEIAEAAYVRRKAQRDWKKYLSDYFTPAQFQGYSFKALAAMDAMLAEATKAANGDATISRRVSLVARIWSFQRAMIENWICAQRIKEADSPDEIAALVRRASSAIEFAESFALSPEEEEWIMPVEGDRKPWPFKDLKSSTLSPRMTLEQVVDGACDRATAKLGVTAACAAWTRLADDPCFAPYAGTQLYQMNHKPMNLVGNASFEKLKPESSLPSGFTPDCKPTNLAGNWAAWLHPVNSSECCFIDSEVAHSGIRSVCIRRSKYGANFFTKVKGRSGDRYRAAAWVRQRSGSCVAGGSLGIQFMDVATGKWFGYGAQIRANVPQRALDGWVRVSCSFTVPVATKGEVWIHPILAAPYVQAEEDCIWWDDVSLEKIWEAPRGK